MMKKSKVVLKTNGGSTAGVYHLSKIVVLVTLTFALCLGTIGCATEKNTNSQLTMGQIMEANRTEKLLDQYQSIYVSMIDGKTYTEPDFRYQNWGGIERMETPNNTYGYADGEYYGIVGNVDMWNLNKAVNDYVGLDYELTALEKIDKVEENDGILTVHTTLSAEDLATSSLASAEDYVAGTSFESVYLLDAKTLVISYVVTNAHELDGSITERGNASIIYNVPRPLQVDTMQARLADPETLRTVTIITNPGTTEEITSITQIPKGEEAKIYYYGDEEWEIYEDAAGTQVADDEVNMNEDILVYCKKN